MAGVAGFLGAGLVLTGTLLIGPVRADERHQQASAGTEVPSGQEIFKLYCASCHGASARGDGPLAENLKVRPPDLTQFAKNNGGQFPAETDRKNIDGREPMKRHGGSQMPVWGDAFRASGGGMSEEAVKERINALVEYLESVQERAGQ